MKPIEGGGASRSTDPASGTSSATDVSLREHVTEKIAALDRHITSEIAALRRETSTATSVAERAVQVAAQEATDRLDAHNGLIEANRRREESNREQQDKQAATFATKEVLEGFQISTDRRLGAIERWQARLSGGMLLLAFIGAANLIKVWTS